MNWTQQQPPHLQEIDQLGSELSVAINCSVHFPAYNKNLFECKCGVIFPVYVVRGRDWDYMRTKHIDEKRMVEA